MLERNVTFAKNEEQRVNQPFAGICSFIKAPICFNMDKLDADVAVIGVPYDMGTTARSGTRFGPRGIREGSMLNSGVDTIYDPERDIVYDIGGRIVDCGDVDILQGDLNQSFENIEAAVRKVLSKGAVPAIMGGDHSITIPIARALDSLGPICVVHLDAHLDWSNEPGGQRYAHGSPMRRLSEMEHIGEMIQIGLRGVGSSMKEDFDDARDYGSILMSPREMRRLGIEEVIERIPKAQRYFVSIDMDVLDPPIAPGTGSPQPGGLLYEELNSILEGVAKKGDVVGFDLVETCPPYDPSGITCQYAAQVMFDLICYILKQKEQKS